jgi:flagella basal body P-ring formation protein FlgA
MTTLKNATLELQTQLATITAEKAQLEHRLQHSQSVLSETQQQSKSRDSQAVADRNARTKAQEELESAQKTVKKLRAKQDTLLAATASGNGNVAAQTAIAERDKCMVSPDAFSWGFG